MTQTTPVWRTSRFDIDLASPKLMAIVNVTPDSFSDGGRLGSASEALRHCEQMLHAGAHILDIGGESSRPGSPGVSLEQELARVLPVVREAVQLGVPVSVDTCKPEVMQAALDLGADIINDIWALRQPGALEVVASHERCGVCLMHMHGEPRTMQAQPMQEEVLAAVLRFLSQRGKALIKQGVAAQRVVVDPGIGFGKTAQQNFALLAQQRQLLALGFGVLVGWSRKSSLGAVTGQGNGADRAVASVAAALLALERGAHVLRVHDVAITRQALQVWCAVQQAALH